MEHIRWVLGMTILLLATTLFHTSILVGAVVAPIKTTITPEPTPVVLHQPVGLRLTIENQSSGSIHLDLGSDRKTNIVLKVTGPDGTTRIGKIAEHSGISRIGRLNLKAGESYVQTLVANEWTGFPQIGVYRIYFSLSSSATLADGNRVEIPSAGTVVKIEAANNDALKEFCSRIVEQLLGAHSYSDSIPPAELLSQIRDPIAIPFLEQAFATKYPVHGLLVKGLETIGNDDAIRALLDLQANRSDTAPEITKQALLRLKNKTTNAELKAKINHALRQ